MKEKLIEVALPLDAIDKASARENSIRHEHPSTLGLPEELLAHRQAEPRDGRRGSCHPT